MIKRHYFDIGCRISEDNIAGQISTVYFQNKTYWILHYCNETYSMLNVSRTHINTHSEIIKAKGQPDGESGNLAYR